MTKSPVPFIEPKVPDWARVAELSAASIRANRWANSGPVSEMFAREVEKLLALGEDRVVVPTSSATTALHAVTGMHAALAGRPLVWVVSAYGFFSTVIGPLAGDVKVIDCNRGGMLDLDRLAALATESWDGLILTDVFGFNAGISDYQSFCKARKKLLVIDSAVSFPARRSTGREVAEIISFHHTKPWGFGEGGCAIVDRDHAELARSFLNYGVGADSRFARHATNGKMSDVAAVVILDRLLRMPDWSRGYHRQRRRMLDLAAKAGVDLLGTPAAEVISPHVPLLAPRPIAVEDFRNARFAVGRYYRPLSKDCPVAADIYARIVNLPCHPAMAEVSDAEILDCLHEVCQTVGS